MKKRKAFDKWFGKAYPLSIRGAGFRPGGNLREMMFESWKAGRRDYKERKRA